MRSDKKFKCKHCGSKISKNDFACGYAQCPLIEIRMKQYKIVESQNDCTNRDHCNNESESFREIYCPCQNIKAANLKISELEKSVSNLTKELETENKIMVLAGHNMQDQAAKISELEETIAKQKQAFDDRVRVIEMQLEDKRILTAKIEAITKGLEEIQKHIPSDTYTFKAIAELLTK